MSTPNNIDLKLLGNLVVDEIYCTKHWPKPATSNTFSDHKKSVGGIGNMVCALKNKSLNLWIEGVVGNDFPDDFAVSRAHISINPSSKALIICDLENSERTSFVNWGCGTEPFNPSNKQSKWTHISYLDVADPQNFEQIRKHTKILSADVCLSNSAHPEKILNKLKYLDYLFISESELHYLCEHDQPIKTHQAKCVIYHQKTLTTIINDQNHSIVINPRPIISHVNVLGAGDAYCANFILYQLTNEPNDILAAQFAHEQTSLFLDRQP